jgi:membrane protein HdeD
MQKNIVAIILIILGIIVLAFPTLGIIPFSVITGFIALILGIGLFLNGVMELSESTSFGVVELILGIIAVILGVGFIVNPGLFSWVAGFLVWIVGLFLVIAGIIGFLNKTGDSRWNGIIAIIIGLIYIIIGTLIANPAVLGALIGIWLLITGIFMLISKD